MDHPVQTASLTEEIGEGAHPLDPLTAREIARATAVIRAHFPWGDDLRVETIDIDEPAKEFVRNHVQGTPFSRIARFNIYRRGELGVWQGRVDLESGEVIAKAFRADARAMVAVEEVLLIEKTVKADPRFQEALRRRGLLADVDNMCIDPWTVGDFGFEERAGSEGPQLLRLDAHVPAGQLLRPPRRRAARADRPEHAGDPARR